MSREMVDAYVERLLEEWTGAAKLVRDDNGGFPFNHDGYRYVVQVTGSDQSPVVRVFSVAVVDIKPTLAMYEDINDINQRLAHGRCFWVDSMVVFEDAMVGLAINKGTLENTVAEISEASRHFGPGLKDRHGGRLVGESQPGDSGGAPEEPAAQGSDDTGLYL